jgi:hypothetical protein
VKSKTKKECILCNYFLGGEEDIKLYNSIKESNQMLLIMVGIDGKACKGNS